MANLLNIKHPSYFSASLDWDIMRDVYAGQKQVKWRKAHYLPATTGHYLDGFGTANTKSQGYKDYNSYLSRARFYNFAREAIQTAIGMMHSQPAEIDLPAKMRGILSSNGENLQQLLRRINTEQLLTGRVGLLLDLPFFAPSNVLPFITTYSAEDIINWDTFNRVNEAQNNARMVVLDESGQVQKTNFEWKQEDAYRVLLIDYDEFLDRVVYKTGRFSGSSLNYSADSLYAVTYQGRPSESIPFVFVNSCDTCESPDEPPLLDLANLCLSIYRMDADYRQSLFMQGQDTLVLIGASADEDEKVKTGAGSRIDLPLGGDAKFIGVESAGLEEQRLALENDKSRAGSMGAQTMDTVSRERESGSSLGIRMGARTASLNQIALAGAKGLEGILQVAAEWMELDPKGVSVTPNLDFGEQSLTAQSMLEMANAIAAGFPLSLQSVHERLSRKGLTTLTFEQEMANLTREREKGYIAKIEQPEPTGGGGGGDT